MGTRGVKTIQIGLGLMSLRLTESNKAENLSYVVLLPVIAVGQVNGL